MSLGRDSTDVMCPAQPCSPQRGCPSCQIPSPFPKAPGKDKDGKKNTEKLSGFMWNKSNAINSCHSHSQLGVGIWQRTAVSYKASPSSGRQQSCTCPQEGIQTHYS